ncbi:hypothetical protein ACJX0J_030245, partial [Zea mays]
VMYFLNLLGIQLGDPYPILFLYYFDIFFPAFSIAAREEMAGVHHFCKLWLTVVVLR